jgi:hypothetical protein
MLFMFSILFWNLNLKSIVFGRGSKKRAIKRKNNHFFCFEVLPNIAAEINALWCVIHNWLLLCFFTYFLK